MSEATRSSPSPAEPAVVGDPMSGPSKGALCVARTIASSLVRYGVCNPTSLEDAESLDTIARAVDGMTGAAKLAEALRDLVSEADNAAGVIRRVTQHTVDKARAALAEWEGGR